MEMNRQILRLNEISLLWRLDRIFDQQKLMTALAHLMKLGKIKREKQCEANKKNEMKCNAEVWKKLFS